VTSLASMRFKPQMQPIGQASPNPDRGYRKRPAMVEGYGSKRIFLRRIWKRGLERIGLA
jgi:hypothetical protein